MEVSDQVFLSYGRDLSSCMIQIVKENKAWTYLRRKEPFLQFVWLLEHLCRLLILLPTCCTAENSTRKRFVGNHFQVSHRSRGEHMRGEKCQLRFFFFFFSQQTFTFWFISLQVKQVDPSQLKSPSRRHPRDFITRIFPSSFARGR